MTDRNDDAIWHPMVSFPDQSASFVHGFEAGQLWLLMEWASPEIERTVHDANREVINRMAGRLGYVATWKPTEVEGWAVVTLTKTRPASHLRAVPLAELLESPNAD